MLSYVDIIGLCHGVAFMACEVAARLFQSLANYWT